MNLMILPYVDRLEFNIRKESSDVRRSNPKCEFSVPLVLPNGCLVMTELLDTISRSLGIYRQNRYISN